MAATNLTLRCLKRREEKRRESASARGREDVGWSGGERASERERGEIFTDYQEPPHAPPAAAAARTSAA